MRSVVFPLVLLCAAPARAADVVHTAEVPLARPKKVGDKRVKEPLDRAVLRVWIPDGVKTVRGVVFNPLNDRFSLTNVTTLTLAPRAEIAGFTGVSLVHAPEPGTLTLALAGLPLLAVGLWRGRRQAT